MAGTLKHAKTSGKAAPTDTTKVGGPDWDADHNFAGGALGSLLYRDTGATDGANWLADVATGSVLVSGGVGTAPAWSATPTLTDLTLTGKSKAADGTSALPSYTFTSSTGSGFSWLNASSALVVSISGSARFTMNSTAFNIGSGGSFGWSSNADPSAAGADLFLARDAASTLAQRNGTTAQAFRLYTTFTDSSNYERLDIFGATGGNFSVLASASGTGTARGLRFGTSGAAVVLIRSNGTDRWQIDSSGHMTAVADNSYDIGASGATRPRNLFLGGTLTLSGGTLLATSAALTNGAAAATGTLTNAPTAGNPTKWIPINDNGTTRYIPAW